METLFLEAPYAGEVKVTDELISKISEYKGNNDDNNKPSIAVFAAVQFVDKVEEVIEQLKIAGINAETCQPARTHTKGQILGCDVYHSNFKTADFDIEDINCFLYLGDGKFHPFALLYAQKDNEKKIPVICYDPIGKSIITLTEQDIEKKIKRYRGSLVKFLSSDKIGIIVTIKPGQEFLRPSKILEEKYPDKKFYYFIDDTLSFNQLENFPFIQSWVNTACPRVGFDDQEKFRNGVINLTDALRAANS